MKLILYDMGHLTIIKWLFHRAEDGPLHQHLKKKEFHLKGSLGNFENYELFFFKIYINDWKFAQ